MSKETNIDIDKPPGVIIVNTLNSITGQNQVDWIEYHIYVGVLF
jgi:hypothetical protein